MANIDNVQLPDGSSYNIVDNTSGFASQSYVDSAVSSITKTTIGLGNVDNTSDLNKPISTATQAALDTLDEDKADKTDIATVESGTTASRAYSVGELVYVSGTLYRVKTAIASGATFTAGTNIEVANVSNAMGDKVNKSASFTALFSTNESVLCKDVATTLNSKMSSNTWITDGFVWAGHDYYICTAVKADGMVLGTLQCASADSAMYTFNYTISSDTIRICKFTATAIS